MRQCRQGREHHQRWKEQPDRLRQGTPVEVVMGQPEVSRQGESDELLTGAAMRTSRGRSTMCVELDGSRRIEPAYVACLVGPDGSRRIVWMIIGMIKGHSTENRMARQAIRTRGTDRVRSVDSWWPQGGGGSRASSQPSRFGAQWRQGHP